jgi:hypothetical protein
MGNGTLPGKSIAFLMIFSIAAFAAADSSKTEKDAPTQLLWSNSKGLISAEGCQASTVADIAQNFDLNIDERPKRTRKLHKASDDKQNPLLFTNLADYVLEIRQNLKLESGDRATFPPSGISLRKSFWQVAMAEDKVLTVVCGETKQAYLLFDVFVPQQIEPLARVGVTSSEISLFAVIEVHTPKEAERAIERRNGSNPVFIKSSNRPKAPGTGEGKGKGKTNPLSAPTSANPAPVGTPSSTVRDVKNHAPSHRDESRDESKSPSVNANVAANVANNDVTSTTEETTQPSPVEVVIGGLNQIVCSTAGTIEVLASDLATRLFTTQPLESIKVVQSFGVDKKSKMHNGRNVTFVKVQFPKRSDTVNLGWIDESIVKADSKCAVAIANRKAKKPTKTPSNPRRRASGDWGRFPMIARTTHSYHEGMRRFRAGRNGGSRLHAACDLYRPQGERIVAVSSGEIIRGRYYFYSGVYAIEVRHSNGFVARYGEILGKVAPGTSQGDRITAGQTLGYVGWIGNTRISPMLHFELFSGSASGALTQTNRPGFQRRSDLLDPTNYLIRWEQALFGTHW